MNDSTKQTQKMHWTGRFGVECRNYDWNGVFENDSTFGGNCAGGPGSALITDAGIKIKTKLYGLLGPAFALKIRSKYEPTPVKRLYLSGICEASAVLEVSWLLKVEHKFPAWEFLKTLVWEESPLANVPPSVRLVTPTEGMSSDPGTELTMLGSAIDSDGSIDRVEFYAGSTLVDTSRSAPYQCRWVGLAPGSYVLTAKAVDNRGGETVSVGVNVRVNPPPPARPVVTRVDPNPIIGNKNGTQNLTVTGLNFQPGLKVRLREPVGSTDATVPAEFSDATWISVVQPFPATTRTWSVQVINPDGLLSDPFPFEVTAPTTSTYGTLILDYNGVKVFSNANTGKPSPQPYHFEPRPATGVNVKTGLEWECVEFVNRYYLLKFDLDLLSKASRNASGYFPDAATFGLQAFGNGGSEAPKPGDILCFGGGPVVGLDDNLGHVAIVREVGLNMVTVVQQNVKQDARDTNFTFGYSSAGGKNVVDVQAAPGSRLGDDHFCQGWLRNSQPAPTVPLAPGNVAATRGDGQVTVSWDTVSGMTYNVYFSTTSGVTKANGTPLTGKTTPFMHTGRTNGTTCYYVVTAVNANGESVESTQVSATPQASTGNPLEITLDATTGLKMRFAQIPANTFTMGCPADEPGRWSSDWLPHQVTLTKGFYMGETEVTQAQYQKIIGTNPSYFIPTQTNYSSGYADTSSQPVETVSWFDSVRFCNALSVQQGLTPCYQNQGNSTTIVDTDTVTCDWAATGYRLPTEAEWEYACRGSPTNTTAFYWGSDSTEATMKQYAWYIMNAFDETWTDPHATKGGTQPVRTKLPNVFGLFDMSGNVWEWCNDWWEDQSDRGSQTDPRGPSAGSIRVLRGGDWYVVWGYCRSADRNGVVPGVRSYDLGFRLVRTIP